MVCQRYAVLCCDILFVVIFAPRPPDPLNNKSWGELKPLCSPSLWPPTLGGARDAVPLRGTIEPLCMWPLLATSLRRSPLDRSCSSSIVFSACFVLDHCMVVRLFVFLNLLAATVAAHSMSTQEYGIPYSHTLT